MAFTKSTLTKTGLSITIVYFLFFPFGQLIRSNLSLANVSIPLQLLDFVVGLSLPLVIVSRVKPHPLRKYFLFFWVISLFSLIFGNIRYPFNEVLRGSLYLIRFVSYYFFFEVVWNIATEEKQKQKFVYGILASLFVTALLGWFQYIYAPDLRYLKLFNWDDHYYRLTGALLDPGFMGIVMAIGVLIATSMFLYKKGKWYLILSVFFAVTCLFTYSRTSIIALVVGLFILLSLYKKTTLFFISFALILGLMFLLPRGEGEGVNLLRTNSIFQKWENYKQTSEVFSTMPLFGVGFNTLCSERIGRYEGEKFENHSCSGSDSSFLFILATTGILGFFTFIEIIKHMFMYLGKNMYSELFISMSGALFVHSLFLNSLFYPWVMGLLFVLLGLSVRAVK